jgi:parallel beta-helix repeat protein
MSKIIKIIWINMLVLAVLFCGCMEEIFNPMCSTEYSVVIEGKGSYPSIQSAIDKASEGDTVLVYEGIYHESLLINKSINLIGESNNSVIIEFNENNTDQKYVIKINADNCTISGFKIACASNSLDIIGIDIYSSNNNISNNNIQNSKYGIYIYQHSKNNIISYNLISNNNYGVYASFSSNNKIFSNNISSNTGYGIYLHSASDNNTIFDNMISDNNYGVRIKGSHINKISGNLFVNNQAGMWFCCGARDNIASYNVFKTNRIWNARDDVVNQWDDGITGNYWDDYTGIDTDDDGIGDTPYNISSDGDKRDRYPLIEEPFEI